MRGASSIIIVFLVVVVVAALYAFLGRAQLTNAVNKLKASRTELETQRMQILEMEAEMPKLTEEIPTWRKQLTLFKQAIPQGIDDHEFMKVLNAQLKQNNVELQRIQVAPVGSWLKDTDEATIETLAKMGLDVETMRKVQVAYYDIQLSGEFADVISTFENLKRFGRLYTVDLITSESGTGGGSVTQIIDPTRRPISLSGAIYYGIPESYLVVESLERVFASRFSGPLARNVFRSIVKNSQILKLEDEAPPATDEPQNGGGNPASGSVPDGSRKAASQGV